MINVHDAASFVCEKSGWKVSNLALQKILYIAHMVHLGRTGDPLVASPFEAWDYGPVAPRLYHRVKAFGSKPIPDIFDGEEPRDGPERETLEEACSYLLDKKPAELIAITHWEGGAWAKHYIPGVKGIVIPDEDIREEYRARTEK